MMESKPTFARLVLDGDSKVGPIDDRLFGALVEHLGRCVYGGIYEPKHPSADADGFRTDVIELVKELGITTVRYPGGNFVSGFRWEDSVGPVESRPRRLDLAWHSTETNQIGVHEFTTWLGKVDAELMMAVNLGTRGVQEALDLLEYCNIPSGTRLSDMRAANGRKEPFDIRMWCLGNEMDGDWQLGHRNAEDYGKLAARTAAAMRQLDPDLDLVVCGSSSHGMKTFGRWEQTVLEHTYNLVDYVSCHAYYHPENGDMASFLASGSDMDRFIREVGAAIDAVRSRLKSSHDVAISFDEWNVWYVDSEPSKNPEGIGNWPVAPHLLEDVYTLADAVVVGDLLITLLGNCDRVRAASLAQLVNVIAPIMTQAGGPAWRQTTFYPFALTARYARGGTVLRPRLSCGLMDTSKYGEVPALDAVAVQSDEGDLTVFVVNRDLAGSHDLEVSLPENMVIAPGSIHAWTLHDEDIYAANTLEEPNRIKPADNTSLVVDGCGSTVTITLPEVSWTCLRVPAGLNRKDGRTE